MQWLGCTGFLTSSKGCTSMKKVDNHWFKFLQISFAYILCKEVDLNFEEKRESNLSARVKKHKIKIENSFSCYLFAQLYLSSWSEFVPLSKKIELENWAASLFRPLFNCQKKSCKFVQGMNNVLLMCRRRSKQIVWNKWFCKHSLIIKNTERSFRYTLKCLSTTCMQRILPTISVTSFNSLNDFNGEFHVYM